MPATAPLRTRRDGGAGRREQAATPIAHPWGVALGCLALATLSLPLVAPAPAYDPWAWLLWGREIAGGDLHTAGGPSFKPLPVLVCGLLSVLGTAAPAAWVLVARVGALLALVLAFRLGRRLAGGSALAGWLAMAGVALCGLFLYYASAGIVTGWVLALALGGAEAWRAGRPRVALACAVGCCLLQVEAWPFAAVLGLVLWRRRPADRRLLAAALLAVPALWFVPELIGSGDPLRSSARARIPNPGQPALADVPALASLGDAAELLLWPLWAGVAALAVAAARAVPRSGPWPTPTAPAAAPGGEARAAWSALVPAAVGIAWIALVAAMSQILGFSGEPRYALPGMALIAISGAVGLVTLGHPRRRPVVGAVAALAFVTIGVAALSRADDLGRLPGAQAHRWALATELTDAIAAAGGRDAVLDCGTPYVGRLRGPLFAYRLDVPKHDVEPDAQLTAPGVVFRSRLEAGAALTPAAPAPFARIGRTERWRVLAACKVRNP